MENMDVKKVFGNDYQFTGPRLKAGDRLQDSPLYTDRFEEVMLYGQTAPVKLIGIFPSVDVKPCIANIKRMNVESCILPDEVSVAAITSDNPFTLNRFAFDKDIEHVRLLSDYNGRPFGEKNGFLLKGLNLLGRALIVVDRDHIVRHIEYAREVESEFDYLQAIKKVKELL